MSAVLFEVEGEHHILSVTRDVTAEREAERARQELEQALRQSQKLESVGVLASGVAHEFRNLLQVIQAYVDLLRKHSPPESSAAPFLRELDQAVGAGGHHGSRIQPKAEVGCGSTPTTSCGKWSPARAHAAEGIQLG
jgi:signal transduction histidine kinase